ncbi:BTB/POZ domain-containing protein 6-B-like [Oculina patagonica]
MSTSGENWQMKTATIRERGKFLLNNELLSDVTFVVERSDGEDNTKKRKMAIPAHKLILSMSSPVFFRMSMVKWLKPQILSICPTVKKFLELHCWDVLDKQTHVVVQRDEFTTIKRSVLEEVVERDTLNIQEIDLFKAVDNWATKACERQSLEPNGATKRLVLGERVLKALRFPVMEQKDFASVVLDVNILRQAEVCDMMKYFSSVLTTPVGFPEVIRANRSYPYSPYHRCGRFNSVAPASWCYKMGGMDSIGVKVDKDVMLHGVCLFGSIDGIYSANVKVARDDGPGHYDTYFVRASDKRLPFTAANELQLQCELVRNASHSYCGFYIMFDQPVQLCKDVSYSVQACISGMESWSGIKGAKSVERSGVTFHFDDGGGRPSSNGTTVSHGQIAEFLFMPK